MSAVSWLVIADDLTGACDTGVVFARRGLRTVVQMDAGTGRQPAEQGKERVEVVVVSTGSRYLPEEQAARAVQEVVQGCGLQPYPAIYKKIDSTLRGHPGSELRAVMRTTGISRALVTPAFPAQGRVVREGRVWVNGLPLEETAFAAEARSGKVRDALGDAVDCRWLPLAEVRGGEEALARQLSRHAGVWIADAESEEDLQSLARAGQQAGIRLWCGSAGLARALASGMQGEQGAGLGRSVQGPALVVAGSRHAATLDQIASLEDAGATVFSLLEEDLRTCAWLLHSGAACDGLKAGQNVVLCARDLSAMPGEEQRIAEALAVWCAEVLAALEHPPALLALTGGDTASAVCRVVGCTQIQLVDEAGPGLALGVMLDGESAGVRVLTKAGGFGQRQALVRAIFGGF